MLTGSYSSAKNGTQQEVQFLTYLTRRDRMDSRGGQESIKKNVMFHKITSIEEIICLKLYSTKYTQMEKTYKRIRRYILLYFVRPNYIFIMS